jgi:hypothetical protein
VKNRSAYKSIFVISSICLVISVIGCEENELKEVEAIHPILNLIQLSSDGLINIEIGSARLKKSNSSTYEAVSRSSVLRANDILELNKGTKITIKFKDESYIIIGPVEQISWYIFEKGEANEGGQ